MLKEALEYLVSLRETKIFEINGETYTNDESLNRVPLHVDRPDEIQVNGLESIALLVRHEMDMMENRPVFIRVCDHRSVEVFTTLDSVMGRDHLYRAVCDAPEFREGWMEQEKAIIALRSNFVPNEGTDYLLELLSRVNKEEGVSSEDNGVSQQVTVRQGVALKSNETVRPRIPLCPYRTFSEVEQPESEFILRVRDDGAIGLFEADGGMWKLQAKGNIYKFFALALEKEIQDGSVVVMM